MSAPGEGPPSLGGQEAPQQQQQQPQQQQQYQAYDPRSNGLSRQPTNPYDMQSPQALSPHKNNGPPARSLTDPPDQPAQDSTREKPRGRSKICGKCGEGLTGQFVRALGDTYHLECFTCHVRTHWLQNTGCMPWCCRAMCPAASAPPRHSELVR